MGGRDGAGEDGATEGSRRFKTECVHEQGPGEVTSHVAPARGALGLGPGGALA